MGREPTDVKSQLVVEICSLSTNSNIACIHRHPCSNVKSHFVDWYRILGVEENADPEVIRRRYHKLGRICFAALQLHPDKNKHPKAEIAFKLVLEAYSCLSDNAKRGAFNVERCKNFCIDCNRIPYTPSATKLGSSWNPANSSRSSHRVQRELKDNRNRFKEETEVVENCLRVNAAARKESPVFNPSDYLFQSNTRQRAQRESPIFNPSDYFRGYPHTRDRFYKKPEDLTYWQRKNVQNYGQEIGRYDSPIFENRSNLRMFKNKSACVHS
ncbi:hypothetical protein Tsubulata_011711 [Turnera subulata]|uniref:J domain-containing protein n=1 Tax=Turnera subulata TaxID=218843 RepID=A0A9Q0G847_9ROSI|nr:hypothetical protein Tsubulata_011711 [Turnera subulata]